MSKVIEIVHYQIVEGQENNLDLIRDKVNNTVKDFDGFISRKVFQSKDDKRSFMDHVEWESLEKAQEAQKQFPSKKELDEFSQAIEKVSLFTHLSEV